MRCSIQPCGSGSCPRLVLAAGALVVRPRRRLALRRGCAGRRRDRGRRVGPAGRRRGAAPPPLITAVAAGTPIIAVLALVAGAGSWALATMLVAPLLGIGIAASLGSGHLDRVAGGALYVGLPALALVWLRSDAAAGAAYVLWLLLVVWAPTSAPISSAVRSAARSWRRGSAPARPGPACWAEWAAPALIGGLVALACGAGFWLAARRRHPAGGRGAVRRPVRIDAEAQGRRQGQWPPDPRPWRTARPHRRAASSRHRCSRAWSGSLPRQGCHEPTPAANGRASAPDHRARRHGLDRAQHAGAGRRGARALSGRGGDRLAAVPTRWRQSPVPAAPDWP